MNKSEIKEVNKVIQYHKAGLEIDWVARALSSLVRAARTVKSKAEIHQVAIQLGANVHPEYIC
jgi:hypothetical protein